MEDFYQILGVSKNASEEDIKRAYRKLAHEHHPDKVSGNEKKFKEINEAYQVLGSKEKRAQYDRFGSTFSQAGGHQHQGGGFGGFSGFDANFDPSQFGDLGDIFESFFGGGGGRRRKTYTRGSDLQINQEIALEEAYTGIKKEISFKAYASCKECAGLGHFAEEGTKQCTTCNGQGEIKEVRNTFFGNFQQVRTCSKCQGSGQIPNKICTECKGAGRTVGTRSHSIEILAGVMDGQLIKITGAGEAGEQSAPAGDLYVQVRVLPHKIFARKENDLYIKKQVTLVDVLLGKKIDLPTISGKTYSVEIPTGFNLSEKLKVSGQGMPRFNSYGHGDMYVELDVRTPKKVSSKARKLLEDLDGEIS